MDLIKKHLTDNENIIWSHSPNYRLLNKYDILSIPLTLFSFGGISVMFTLYLYLQFKVNPGAAFYFLSAGLLVYVISFYFILGRFFYRRKRRTRERYVLTEKRAIIITDLVNDEVRSVFLENTDIKIVGKSIFFGEENPLSELFYNLGLDAVLKFRPKNAITFRGIENPEEIYKLIQNRNEGGKS